MIDVGSKMDTDFQLEVFRDGESETVRFQDLLDRKTIVSVYMRNNTSSCDKQNRSLAGQEQWFRNQGYNLVAVSKDTCGSHEKYADKLGIHYALASDPEYRFAQATDSMVEKKMYGKTFEAPSRSAFVIDTDGTVLAVLEKVDTKDHATQLRALVETL